ncbi:MAG: hypothetical protein ACK55Z_26390, partial [bacterium]
MPCNKHHCRTNRMEGKSLTWYKICVFYTSTRLVTSTTAAPTAWREKSFTWYKICVFYTSCVFIKQEHPVTGTTSAP